MSTRPTVRRPYSAGSAPDDQGDAADPAGVENAAEAGQAIGQHHAIDAKLYVGVIVAHVKKPACGGVLRHPRGLQQDFLHRLVVAAGKRLDGRLGDGGGRCADGRVEIAAALIEGVGLGVKLRGRCDGCRRCRRGNMHAPRLWLRFCPRDDDLGKLGWRGLRAGKIRKSDQKQTGTTAEKNSAVSTNRHDASSLNSAKNGQSAGPSGVVLTRHVEMSRKRSRSILRTSPAQRSKRARQCRRSATTGQASGGARD